MKHSLLFVYNAHSGMFNTMADIAHKAFSPGTYQCSLCQITHNLFNEKSEWREFIASLEIPCKFLHIDEFREKYKNHTKDFPALFLSNDEKLTHIATAKDINRCKSLEDLKNLVLRIVSQIN
ncbi:MAG: hypothetical protein DWQ05_16160 [Calditrichaeota bacterium]|nr:MAG: hypothetical protein DWQ05_16160 [Calditrichota bacterium]